MMVNPGVCIIRESWELDHKAAVSEMAAAGFKIRFTKIIPDLIVSSLGVSVAFIFVGASKGDGVATDRERIQKMAGGFQYSYVLSTVDNQDQQAYRNFADLCFNSAEGNPGRPAVVAIPSDADFAQCVMSMVEAHADCKEQGTTLRFSREMEEFVQSSDATVSILTNIPGINVHEALSLIDGAGSLAKIASLSADQILRCTDLSPEQARSVETFFDSIARH